MQKTTDLLDKLKQKKLKLVSAESCTGGLLAATLTTIPGSSDVYDRGFITYSNEAKMEMLDVPRALIEKHGAVSAEVAAAMAKGALKNVSADIAIAITGIAGPKTSEHKPVGLVYIAVCHQGKTRIIENHLSGSRIEIQTEAVSRAFDLIGSVV
jgi:nicotinamide-nucleotide amidase